MGKDNASVNMGNFANGNGGVWQPFCQGCRKSTTTTLWYDVHSQFYRRRNMGQGANESVGTFIGAKFQQEKLARKAAQRVHDFIHENDNDNDDNNDNGNDNDNDKNNDNDNDCDNDNDNENNDNDIDNDNDTASQRNVQFQQGIYVVTLKDLHNGGFKKRSAIMHGIRHSKPRLPYAIGQYHNFNTTTTLRDAVCYRLPGSDPSLGARGYPGHWPGMCVLNSCYSGAGNGNINSATIDAATSVVSVGQSSTAKFDNDLQQRLGGTINHRNNTVAFMDKDKEVSSDMINHNEETQGHDQTVQRKLFDDGTSPDNQVEVFFAISGGSTKPNNSNDSSSRWTSHITIILLSWMLAVVAMPIMTISMETITGLNPDSCNTLDEKHSNVTRGPSPEQSHDWFKGSFAFPSKTTTVLQTENYSSCMYSDAETFQHDSSPTTRTEVTKGHIQQNSFIDTKPSGSEASPNREPDTPSVQPPEGSNLTLRQPHVTMRTLTEEHLRSSSAITKRVRAQQYQSHHNLALRMPITEVKHNETTTRRFLRGAAKDWIRFVFMKETLRITAQETETQSQPRARGKTNKEKGKHGMSRWKGNNWRRLSLYLTPTNRYKSNKVPDPRKMGIPLRMARLDPMQ